MILNFIKNKLSHLCFTIPQSLIKFPNISVALGLVWLNGLKGQSPESLPPPILWGQVTVYKFYLPYPACKLATYSKYTIAYVMFQVRGLSWTHIYFWTKLSEKLPNHIYNTMLSKKNSEKMAPLVSTFSLPQSTSERLSSPRKDAAIASELYKKGGIDPRTARLRKRPSVLFRLWNAVLQPRPKPFHLPEEETRPIASVEETLVANDFESHPLYPYYTSAPKVNKQRGNLPHEASVFRYLGITHKDGVMVDMCSAPGDGPVMDSSAVPETVGPDAIAGGRWEADYFKGCGKNVRPKIGHGEINIDGHYPVFFCFLN